MLIQVMLFTLRGMVLSLVVLQMIYRLESFPTKLTIIWDCAAHLFKIRNY